MSVRLLERIELQDNSTQLADLVVVKRIPKDVPGAPFLVIHSISQTFYVLQVVEKTALTPHGLLDFEAEKQLLLSIYHPFLLRYIKYIEDSRFSYILTVYYEKAADLFEVLRVFGRPLTEDEAKFYLSCLILIVEFLHRRKVAVRNLHPERILIDPSGYPLIHNLEYAKKLSEKTFTMVNTPHYMPPEMITSKGYGLAVDYWSLGVILYESLCGRVPFGEEEVLPMKVYAEVLKGEFSFPDEISSGARKVIKSLLESQPSRRATGSLSKLKKFPWFEGTDWVRDNQDSLLTRKAKTPFQLPGKDMRQLIPKAMAKGETVIRALSVFSI
jgi:serine/threonine protein kinase